MGALQGPSKIRELEKCHGPAGHEQPRAGRLAGRSQRVLLASAVLGALSVGLVLPRGTTTRPDDDKNRKDGDQYTAPPWNSLLRPPGTEVSSLVGSPSGPHSAPRARHRSRSTQPRRVSIDPTIVETAAR